MTSRLHFTKGHGTQNDFVLVPDLEGVRDLSATEVAAIADRHAGIGGDGVIRVVPTQAAGEASVRAQAGSARWFMDYRNADGSLAEMCGNGVRVFVAYLLREGLVAGDEVSIATRAGLRQVSIEGEGPDRTYVIDMGGWRLSDPEAADERGFDSLVHIGEGDPFSGLSIEVGNPHTVLALPESVELDSIDLTRPPIVRPQPPHGTNVELVRPVGPGHIALRVHERGVGETRSCGTGACAAAIGTAFWAGSTAPGQQWRVDVPGGRLGVRLLPGESVELSGPAVLVADGEISTSLLGPG